ncbi:hypothetical protein AC579_4338 [Pseudocercospora musae]|uniref:Uncharacterized protein n=1 Tax=Pseudocercospora musae TaxID=113226 RepID=A0A139IR38_9PEZI|nr:hypothetical protein AC579_4338 [Pseudocercospora musae]
MSTYQAALDLYVGGMKARFDEAVNRLCRITYEVPKRHRRLSTCGISGSWISFEGEEADMKYFATTIANSVGSVRDFLTPGIWRVLWWFVSLLKEHIEDQNGNERNGE